MGCWNHHVLLADWQAPNLARRYEQAADGANNVEVQRLCVPEAHLGAGRAPDQQPVRQKPVRPVPPRQRPPAPLDHPPLRLRTAHDRPRKERFIGGESADRRQAKKSYASAFRLRHLKAKKQWAVTAIGVELRRRRFLFNDAGRDSAQLKLASEWLAAGAVQADD